MTARSKSDSQRQTATDLDVFAMIAARGSTRTEGLVELPAPVVPMRILPSGGTSSWRPPKKSSDAAGLARDLRSLRRRHAPYLRECDPPLPPLRPRIAIDEMDWRLEPDPDAADQQAALAGRGAWQRVRIPHYGGPVGRAVAWYRHRFRASAEVLACPRRFVCLRGVDYHAEVWLNGVHLGSHEGFFGEFALEATAALRAGVNVLVIRVENDGVANGSSATNPPGEKLYAATGPGWDEPGVGWHHCPPGMGVWQPVWLEGRQEQWIEDLWVRPLPGLDAAEAWVEVGSSVAAWRRLRLELTVHGRNFRHRQAPLAVDLPWEVWRGGNAFRFRIPMPSARTWHPDTPWLYRVHARLLTADGTLADSGAATFGMRTFAIAEHGEPKGRLLLNGREVRLRGANTMGHEQQCVMRGDFRQLEDDILIAKAANLNVLRLTQRPVQREVYEACDRLGIMLQTDFPLFGVLPRRQAVEALRQVREMVRLVRGHPSVVLASWINEPFPDAWGIKLSRAMSRSELERWFIAAEQVTRIEHPDLAIKPVDGDYNPPSPGLPDGHAYPFWYNGHAIDAGALHAGRWVPGKPGWNRACGEYGAEGLDPVELMRRRYPTAWLPAAGDESGWSPAAIAQAQTGTFQYMFFPRPRDLAGWVAASQAYQAYAIRMQTEALRRIPGMVATYVHLLIDAWPAGWMKSLVDCERRPKPAYFALRDACAPVMPMLRCDRRCWWGGERLEVEVWLANDRPLPVRGKLHWRVECDGRLLAGGTASAALPGCSAVPVGRIRQILPQVAARQPVRIAVALVDTDGAAIAEHELAHEVWPADVHACGVGIFGERRGPATRLAEQIGLRTRRGSRRMPQHLILDHAGCWDGRVDRAVREGASALVLASAAGDHPLAGGVLTVKEHSMGGLHFVAAQPGHTLLAGIRAQDLHWWHDESAGRVTPLCTHVIEGDAGWNPVLSAGNCGWGVPRREAAAAVERRHGRGRVIACQVALADRVRTNPPALILALRLLGLAGGG